MVVSYLPCTPPLNAHDAGQMHPLPQYPITPTRPARLSPAGREDAGQVIQAGRSPEFALDVGYFK